MDVLVAYATRHGSTAGIAEHLAASLCERGVPTHAIPVNDVTDVRAYDAVVLGGAAYMSHWLKDATSFARRHRVALRERPVWLFSSGPLGTDLVDPHGRDVVEVCRPQEFDELTALVRARAERTFFGAWDPTARHLTLSEHVLALMPASKTVLTAGDFRDWPAIEAWAGEISAALASMDPEGGDPARRRVLEP